LDWPLRPDRYYLVGVGAVGTRRPYWEGSPALIEAAGLRPVGYLHSTTTWAPTSLTSDPSTARLYAQELDIMLWDDADLDADGDGYSPWCGDCDDLDPDVHPGAPETCDGVDDDCDGLVDEGC
jgi:hypothetical protein